MKITEKQKQKLHSAWDWCNKEDKSTEFMICYMQDYAECTHNQVIEFLISESE